MIVLLVLAFAFLIWFSLVLEKSFRTTPVVRHVHFQPPKRVWIDARQRPPTPGWVVFKSFSEAEFYFDEYSISEVSLDYESGFDVIKEIRGRAERGLSIPEKIVTHAKSSVRRAVMQGEIDAVNNVRGGAIK